MEPYYLCRLCSTRSSMLRFMILALVGSLYLSAINTPAAAQDSGSCTPISPNSPGSTPLKEAVGILKSGKFYLLYQTAIAPASGLDIVRYTSTAIDALKGAAIIIGEILNLFEGTAVYNGASDSCWNVEGNYGLPGGRMISYPCQWGIFTEVNFKFGVTDPDSDGWSQIGAEPSGIARCLNVGTHAGDPLFTATNCDSSDDQQKFAFLPIGGADYLFIHKATMQCLYLASDGIRTNPCNVDDPTQRFQWCNHVTRTCTQASGSIFNPC